MRREMRLRFPATCRDHAQSHPMAVGELAYGQRINGRWDFICADAHWGNEFAEQEREQEARAFQSEYMMYDQMVDVMGGSASAYEWGE